MKILVITVAGMSTRFSESIGKQSIKCIYYEDSIKECLLYQLMDKYKYFDRYVIVGGFGFEELKKEIEQSFSDYISKIILVKNNSYKEYGSGYSLYLGLKATMRLQPKEIVFAEGDLFVDEYAFGKVVESNGPVLTINHDVIKANKSVVFYYDKQQKVHYVYDLSHNELIIPEPFIEIYNSGQIWKFIVDETFMNVYNAMSIEEWKGTNLVFIQKYFETINRNDCKIISFEKWINCNTIDDFRRIQKENQHHENAK